MVGRHRNEENNRKSELNSKISILKHRRRDEIDGTRGYLRTMWFTNLFPVIVCWFRRCWGVTLSGCFQWNMGLTLHSKVKSIVTSGESNRLYSVYSIWLEWRDVLQSVRTLWVSLVKEAIKDHLNYPQGGCFVNVSPSSCSGALLLIPMRQILQIKNT